MQRLVLALGLIILVTLTACSRGGTTSQPLVSQPTSTAAPLISAKTESHNLSDLSQAQPYLVVKEGNISNEDASRTAGLWYITAPGADNHTAYAQTAIKAALDLYNYYRRDFTSVLLVPSAGVTLSYAQANYAADGLGASGMTGSAKAKPMYWRVRALDDAPLSPMELKVAELWQQKMSDFPSHDMLSSLSYDEKALRQYIAETLNISYSDTVIRQLAMRDYLIEDSPINHPSLKRFPNPPLSEELIQSYFPLRIQFSQAEKEALRQSAIQLPINQKAQFEALFASAYAVSQDSRWNVYSSWRTYVQSTEYQQIRDFCGANGQTVWPLLFARLDSESGYFASGIIVDSTLPEHLNCLEWSFNNLVTQGSSFSPVVPISLGQYVRALMALGPQAEVKLPAENRLPTGRSIMADLPLNSLDFETAWSQIDGYSIRARIEWAATRTTVSLERDDPRYAEFINLFDYSVDAWGGADIAKGVKDDFIQNADSYEQYPLGYILTFSLDIGDMIWVNCAASSVWYETQDTLYRRVFSPELRSFLEQTINGMNEAIPAPGIVIQPQPGQELAPGTSLSSVSVRPAVLDRDYFAPFSDGRTYRKGEDCWLVSGQVRSELEAGKYMILHAVGYDANGNEVARSLDAGPLVGLISVYLPPKGYAGFLLHLPVNPEVVRIDLLPSKQLSDIRPP